MAKKIFKSLALVLLIVGALAWLYSNLRTDAINPAPYAALGEGAANETAKLLNDAGQLVLVDADYGIYKILAPTTEAAIKAFKQGIRKTHLKITASERVPIAPPSMARTGIFMQPGQLAGLVARHPDADGIVLFVGLAGPGDLEGVIAQNRNTKLILVSNYEPYYKALLEKRLIQLAIVPRLGAADKDGEAIGSGRKWFERHYLVATPERMAELVN